MTKKLFILLTALTSFQLTQAQTPFAKKLDLVLGDWKNNFQSFAGATANGQTTGTAGFPGALAEYIEPGMINAAKKDYVVRLFEGSNDAVNNYCTTLRDIILSCTLKNFQVRLTQTEDGIFRYEFFNKSFRDNPNDFKEGVLEIAVLAMPEKISLPAGKWFAEMRVICK
jgi:hypothetical protein